MLMMAFKNIRRYKYRSFLVTTVIFFSAIATVLCTAMMEGVIDHMFNDFIKYDTAHIRMVSKEFKKKEKFYPLYFSIKDVSLLKKEILQELEVKQVVPSIRYSGLISSPDYLNIPVNIFAFDMQDNTFDLDTKLVFGEILKEGVILGTSLAEKLSLKIGAKIILSSTTSESSLNASNPIINALVHFSMPQFDKHTVFIDIKTAQKLFKLEDSAPEIFILLNHIKDVGNFAKILEKQYPNFAIETYKKQMGTFYLSLEVEKKILYLLGIMIMIFGSMVIATSISAGIYERFSEIGILKAIGFKDSELASMLIYEGAFYGFFGGFTGFLCGFLLIQYLSKVGLDFSSGLSGIDIPMSTIIYPKMIYTTIILNLFIVLIVPILVSLFPINILRKISPIEAISRDF